MVYFLLAFGTREEPVEKERKMRFLSRESQNPRMKLREERGSRLEERAWWSGAESEGKGDLDLGGVHSWRHRDLILLLKL